MNATKTLQGIHHITAIAADPAENVEFYEQVLGLHLVKRTVNFDDPHTYHLYYGDRAGTPGTILTFFPWTSIPRGRSGAGMVTGIAFGITRESVAYWLDRLAGFGVETVQEKRFGEDVISFSDPHGLALELIAAGDDAQVAAGDAAAEDEAQHIRGFHSATALLRELEPTRELLTGHLGFTFSAREGQRYRYRMGTGEAIGRFYDLVVDPAAAPGIQGTGTVHHIAFRTPSAEEQLGWQRRLRQAGYGATDVRDRTYFKSIYCTEPGGVLFEIATDPPGFTVDEAPDRLGQGLMLPSRYEPMRAAIEAGLPSLRTGRFIHEYIEPAYANAPDFTLVALHGTGGDERDLLPLARHVGVGAAILSPRGTVSENNMNRFFKRLAPGVFDEVDLGARANDLADFLLEAAARYRRPVDGLVPLGYSNGANMAAALLFIRPELFRRAILLRPMMPLGSPPSVNLVGREILILRGRSDTVIPAAGTEALIGALRDAGAEVEAVTLEAGHELTDEDVHLASQWLLRTTGSKPAHLTWTRLSPG